MEVIKIRQYTSADGTILVEYKDNVGYVNTVPLSVFKKKFNPKSLIRKNKTKK